ncbi:alpha/beta hydrolase family protein [Nonomuraea sp. NPDC049714]|uniref:alpha/beta hydrolase family protein n=1 Tax=Nonomuraea sp. NPDC049714 TaxID=3364357 RepID=UPI00379F870D
MVLVHGAGTGTPRTKLMAEAVEFARRGMSVLVHDKRSEGYSLFQRSYAQLADDALGAVATLRRQQGVDPAKVGIWGLSEGGWVAPIAASRTADIAFVVLVGANSLPPLRQQVWAVAAGLRKAGVSGSVVDRAEHNFYRMIADGGMFPEPYYDPEPALTALRQPLLGIWGTHDLLTPPRESPPLFAKALDKGGNQHYTFRFFADADHAAHRTPDGGVTRLPELAPGRRQAGLSRSDAAGPAADLAGPAGAGGGRRGRRRAHRAGLAARVAAGRRESTARRPARERGGVRTVGPLLGVAVAVRAVEPAAGARQEQQDDDDRRQGQDSPHERPGGEPRVRRLDDQLRGDHEHFEPHDRPADPMPPAAQVPHQPALRRQGRGQEQHER